MKIQICILLFTTSLFAANCELSASYPNYLSRSLSCAPIIEQIIKEIKFSNTLSGNVGCDGQVSKGNSRVGYLKSKGGGPCCATNEKLLLFFYHANPYIFFL